MAALTAQQAYDKISTYIIEKGGAYSQWCVGIATDWEDRLFNGHQVPNRNYQWWIARECISNAAAREAEDALHELGCDGGPGGGGEATVHIYAYLKGTMTNP